MKKKIDFSKRDKEIIHEWMKRLSDGCDDIMNDTLIPYHKSKTDINNFKDPFYSVILEDGPSHCGCLSGSYESSSSQLYFSSEQMSAFYKTLPYLARYYKVTIRIIENPNPLPF